MNTLLALLFVGQMCGDCDNSGRVDIAEAITVVRNMLGETRCHEGCFSKCFPFDDGCPCAGVCGEHIRAVVNGVEVQCALSLCDDDPVQECVAAFYHAHPTSCTVSQVLEGE